MTYIPPISCNTSTKFRISKYSDIGNTLSNTKVAGYTAAVVCHISDGSGLNVCHNIITKCMFVRSYLYVCPLTITCTIFYTFYRLLPMLLDYDIYDILNILYLKCPHPVTLRHNCWVSWVYHVADSPGPELVLEILMERGEPELRDAEYEPESEYIW